MPTEKSAEELALQAQANSLHRLDHTVVALNERIARLAIALGVSLEHEEDVRRVLQHKPATRAPSHDAHAPPHNDSHHDMSHVWTELRGLLVMRYGIEKHIADDLGASVTRRVFEQAEAQLASEGFKPGADGLDMSPLSPKS